jgi:hypothetical protein
MKDGVEYVLRFGAGTSIGTGMEEADAESDSTGRYLLVMARFNEALLAKPVLDPVPDVPESTDGKPADAQAGAAGEAVQGEGGAAELLKAADEAEAKAQAALEERRRVERENRRRQDDYDAKVKAAQRRVRELNARFADWYYVVPSREYAKIHLDRSAIVQARGADGASAGGGAAFPPGAPGGAAFPGRFPPQAPPAPSAPTATTGASSADSGSVPAVEPPPAQSPAAGAEEKTDAVAPPAEPPVPAADAAPGGEAGPAGEQAPPSPAEPATAGS